MTRIIIRTVLLILIIAPFDNAFSNSRINFAIVLEADTSNLSIFSHFTLPHKAVDFKIISNDQNIRLNSSYTVLASQGTIKDNGNNVFQWQAPDSAGSYKIFISHNESGEKMILNVFVMEPLQNVVNGMLNGYRIGFYPKPRIKENSIYAPPKGFIQVTESDMDLSVTPHFKLGQFVCKQPSTYPRYIVLTTKLLLKLEFILDKLNESGIQCQSFHVMSGYRTPHYNKNIGNVRFSRHIWGDAADVFIDENPKDGLMDDINKDGTINYNDACYLYDIIDELYPEHCARHLVGGLGKYPSNSVHGPFIHIDARGHRARWGTPPRMGE